MRNHPDSGDPVVHEGRNHPEPERAVAEPPSEPEEPEPLLTPTPPADGKPPEVLLAHTPDSFVAAVRERLGCRTQLPRKVYGAY